MAIIPILTKGDEMSSLNSIMKERLGFLFDCQMDEPFWFLLCGARSVHHLEKLHDSLPPNCRLLRPDFIKLKEFFLELPSLMEPQAAELRCMLRVTPEERDRITLNLFRGVYSKGNLTDYYFHRLHDGRDRFDFRRETRAKMICSLNVSPGLQSFNARLFDADFRTDCFFSGKTGQIGVSLSIWSNELTEPLTFKLLSLPRSTFDYFMTGNHNFQEVSELVLSFALSAESVQEYMGRGKKTTVDIKRGRLEEFCGRLKQLLVVSGIPAQVVTPVITKR